MPFLLSRGGANVLAEVQRWQYFLLKQGFPIVGSIDAEFGQNTETGTKLFQTRSGIPVTGKLDARTLDVAQTIGYTVKPNNYYSERSSAGFPARPSASTLASPDNATRNANFKCFKFKLLPRDQRPDKEGIVITASCDGSDPDWIAANVINIDIPQLKFARGYVSSRFRTHAKAAPQFAALFAKWEAADLLHLIMSFEGCFVPRYKRGLTRPPLPNAGHGIKKSTDADAGRLSNHAFGSAFDINFTDNQLGHQPAICGQRGSTRELVEAANSLGIYWGGHFSTAASKDGMHFEISKLS